MSLETWTREAGWHFWVLHAGVIMLAVLFTMWFRWLIGPAVNDEPKL